MNTNYIIDLGNMSTTQHKCLLIILKSHNQDLWPGSFLLHSTKPSDQFRYLYFDSSCWVGTNSTKYGKKAPITIEEFINLFLFKGPI